MAANRFATMLHRNTNRITLVLTYAVLEWILIALLLLNSLFSYLIVKFAEFFGLKPPCPWCTRIDHIIDADKENKNKNMNRDLLCEVHSKEISRLGYCSNHHNLVEFQNLCEDCLPSNPEFPEKSKNNGEVKLNCSCCGVSFDNDKYSSYILLKTSSWDVLECAQKENYLITDEKLSDFADGLCDDEKVLEDKNENRMFVDGNLELGEKDLCLEEEKGTLIEENSNSIMNDKSVQVCVQEDAPVEVSSQHLEFFLDYSGNKLVPIELIDSVVEEEKFQESCKNVDQEFRQDSEVGFEEKGELFVDKVDTFIDVDINEEPKYTMLEKMEIEEDENSLVFHAKDSVLVAEEFANFRAFPLAQWPSQEASDVQEMAESPMEMHSNVHSDYVACEEEKQEEVAQANNENEANDENEANNENEADVSIGTEIPDLDITGEIQIQDSVHSYDYTNEDPSTTSTNLHKVADHDPSQYEEHMRELQSLSIKNREHTTNNHSSSHLEINEAEEEDKVPDTPTSTDSFTHLHKKLLLLEKRDSGAEESLDGSVTSEFEGNDIVQTVEGLKSALKAERKALQALYSELEEERSASAVAANQTMAMINRLQEEKAAMQMEALQYQRMMEEQSEYDQEALQLLNELMVKREREKQELEKEMEVYKKKLFDYETKERIRVLRSSKSGFSSASCSINAEDSDGLSVDLNQEVKEEDGFYSNQENGNLDNNTPVDAVLNLEESLADFEEERVSILDQLKVLEEKLSTLDDGENGHENGFSMNGKKHYMHKGKSLLPLFDAISDENGDMMMNGDDNENGFDSDESKFEIEEKKKLVIEEEVDHLYERLQALEADREFLKHCISSLKKGDKGMDLLQEILQHLRDLRNVEVRARNF